MGTMIQMEYRQCVEERVHCMLNTLLPFNDLTNNMCVHCAIQKRGYFIQMGIDLDCVKKKNPLKAEINALLTGIYKYLRIKHTIGSSVKIKKSLQHRFRITCFV